MWVPNKLMDISGNLIDKTVSPSKQSIYENMFDEMFIAKVRELEIKAGNKIGPEGMFKFEVTEASSFLFKDNLSIENKIKKDNIINEVKKEARKETAKLTFDYSENPLLIHKMGQYIPFMNYTYSGIRLLQRYPKSMMFSAIALNNLNLQYGNEVWYTDDQGERVDAGISMRIGALSMFGLAGVSMNLQRLMQYSPTNSALSPHPLFSFLTNRDDFRYKKFYESGSIEDFQKIGIGLLSPTLQKLFNGIESLGKEIDPKTKENGYKDFTESMVYFLTGTIIKDKTQSVIWKAYIERDYEKLMTMSDTQLNLFFSHPTNKKNGLDKQAIKAALKATEL